MEGSHDPPTHRPFPQYVVHEVLAAERRRAVLAVLEARETPIVLERLARAVTAQERGTRPTRVSIESVEATTLTLHHTHLPKLVEHDVVEYDTTAKVVDTGANFDNVATWTNESRQ